MAMTAATHRAIATERTTWSGARLGPRLEALRAEIIRRKGSFVDAPNPFERDVALFRVPRDFAVVQTRARLLRELVALATIDVRAGWRLAGEHLPHRFGLEGDASQDRRSELAALGVEPDRFPEVQQRVRSWQRRAEGLSFVGPLDPATRLGQGTWLLPDVYLSGGWVENHSIRDYAKVLRIGFGGIREEVEARLRAADIADPGYPEKECFWSAALDVCAAGELLGARYAELCRARGLDDAAQACSRVPARGARTLVEAVQSLWLAHVLTCGEDGINANSLGRLDQILEPFYQADLAAGRIDRAGALELMQELACKLYLEYDVQAITLCGVDAAGRSAANDMSRIILEATGDAGFVRDLSVRIAPDTPHDLVRLSAELVARGGGIPFFFNDRSFIPALVERGIAEADARNYAPIGCIELTVPGKANPHAVSGWINAARCLELALFDGCDPATGARIGPATGMLTDLGSFEELARAYRLQLEHFTRGMVLGINRGELAQREQGPLPCWSVLTDDCIARGRDVTNGGARYFYHSVCFLGTANTADSLAAVRKLVYEQKRVGAGDLLAALRADFAGCEPLRQLLLNGAPKYGNDLDEVDSIAVWVANHFIDFMDTFTSPLGGRFFVHLFSFLKNVDFGRSLGATPDGRRRGEPIAYSLSAQQGRDEKGVTALLRSIAKLPHHRAAGATAAMVDLDPSFVAGERGVDRLADLIRAAMDLGVGQVQWNVVSVERLEQARRDPESWGNIPVRVAGYSQLFRLLDADLQDHVIARTKHRG
jgi:pyruvate-formate lyase